MAVLPGSPRAKGAAPWPELYSRGVLQQPQEFQGNEHATAMTPPEAAA